MAVILRQRRDTAANWTTNNPVIPDGQLCFDETNNTFRIGNGASNYADLSIQSGVAGGGLSNTVDDTTPQLGGDLDLNGHAITGITTGADVSYTALAVADLGDAATPSVLTTAETTGKLISNYKSSGADHVFTMPAAHTKGNVIFIIGDEFQIDIEPVAGDLFYLNGTAMAADEHIVNIADTLGQQIVGMCANINGTLRWMFKSDSADFAEATP